jgi:ketosteroid isomerase-like protein
MKHSNITCFTLITMTLLFSCTSPQNPVDTERAKQEIRDVEKAFADMVATQGLEAGFLHYAADNVVLLRGNRLIGGKDAMQKYFGQSSLSDVQLTWKPAFVDVAASGDMGYTYGPYTFSAVDTAGNPVRDTGYFHTVWKKQEDGEWKFVWD